MQHFYALLLCIVARCVIDGQECVETCVTACPPTCENPEPKSCTAECIVGCQCPNGTVLDEENNKCVMKKDCGMYLV